MKDDTNYLDEAEEDAWRMANEFIEEIIEYAVDSDVSDDYNNDYNDGDSYHHENHVDKSYRLLEAANLLDQLSDFTETDNGLWEGQDPQDAVSTQAAYTYGNAVNHYWCKIIKDINRWLNSIEWDNDEDRTVTSKRYITILINLHTCFEPSDCDGLVRSVLNDIEDLEWTSAGALCDWMDEHDEKPHLAKQFRLLLGLIKE